MRRETYTPITGKDGSSYLGSKSDLIYGGEGYQRIGWVSSSDYEAKEGNIRYSFEFIYTDGSDYGGTVSSNSTSYNYSSGEDVTTAYGKYVIGANDGYTSQPSGTVTETGDFYYEPGARSYPIINTTLPAGVHGLGSEFDAFAGGSIAYGFGLGGKYEI